MHTFSAFISYPDALAKLKFVPQLFSFLFFFMLFLLGIGSLIAMVSLATTLIKDRFVSVKNWQSGLGFAVFGVVTGSVYLTPVTCLRSDYSIECNLKYLSKGGSSVLELIDFYGATFTVFILSVAELLTFCYIYGVDRICKDIEFMLDRKMGYYWKICWRYVTPGLMTIIAVYTLINFELPKDGNYDFPVSAHVIGWTIASISLSQVIIFAVYRLSHQKSNTSFWEVKKK